MGFALRYRLDSHSPLPSYRINTEGGRIARSLSKSARSPAKSNDNAPLKRREQSASEPGHSSGRLQVAPAAVKSQEAEWPAGSANSFACPTYKKRRVKGLGLPRGPERIQVVARVSVSSTALRMANQNLMSRLFHFFNQPQFSQFTLTCSTPLPTPQLSRPFARPRSKNMNSRNC